MCLLACGSGGTLWKIQNWGFFWPKSVKKWPFLPKILFLGGFLPITSIFVISLDENSLKSSPKCLLACVSSGTRGKIQNWGFFGQKVSKNGHFCQKSNFLKVFDQ